MQKSKETKLISKANAFKPFLKSLNTVDTTLYYSVNYTTDVLNT